MISSLLRDLRGGAPLQIIFLIVALALGMVGAGKLSRRFHGELDGIRQPNGVPTSEEVIRRINAEIK